MRLVSGKHVDFVSKIAASVAQIAPRDFTITTNNGDIKVNSDVLREKSDVFRAMLTSKETTDKKVTYKEATANKVTLGGYSKEAVDLLTRCLYAPFASDIYLPKDSAVVLELIDLANKYGFNELIPKLEPGVINFIQQRPEVVVDNAEAWLNLLLPLTANTQVALPPEEAAKGQIAAKWILELTPHLLKAVEIPTTLSTIPGKYEIPAEHANAFFNEDTRDLLQHLPVVLNVKDGTDLDTFMAACNEATVLNPLSIKLFCPIAEEDKARINDLAKSKNVALEFLNPIPPDATVFGGDFWDKYFGSPGKVPPIPADKIKELYEPDPYNPGKMKKETRMLVLWPATVNGEPLNLITLRELVKNPQGGGHKIDYRYIYDPILTEHGTSALKESRWVLMTKDVIPGSRNKDFAEQKALVEAAPNYKVPSHLAAAVCILTHYVHTGVRLFSDAPYTYTRCEEMVEGYHIVVGGFAPAGLSVSSHHFDYDKCGVAALR